MTLLKTVLKRNIDKLLFQAFMEGQGFGDYELYCKLHTEEVSIQFKTEADVTAFRLKDLDVVYNRKYGKFKTTTTDSMGISNAFDDYIKNHMHK